MKRLVLLAVLVVGLVCGSAGFAAEVADAGAGLEQGLAKCLALEEAGEFAGALQACSDLATQYAAIPDAGKAQKLLAKLKQEKRTALQLSFAVEKLASDAAGDQQVARDQLMETPDVGAILLRQTVRKGAAKGVLAAIAILQEMGDAKAAVAYADRLKVEPPGALSDALIQAIEERQSNADPQERDTVLMALGALVETMGNDFALDRRDAVGLLLRLLTERFHGQVQAVDAFLKKPGAFDALRLYVSRVGASPDKEIASWAFARYDAVGLSRFGGQVIPAGAFATWSRKMKIALSGYNKPEPLINFPLLVVLSTNISGFSYGDFLSKSNADLRFTDATGTTALNYEIESWDTKDRSYVWVQVPKLSGTNDCIYAYWGKSGTNAPASTTSGSTWVDGFQLVEHMALSNGTTVADSSPNGKTALVTNEFAYSSSGPVGSALNLTRTADANNGLILDATVPLGSNWTVSCWFNELRSPGDWRTLLRGPTAEHQVLVENNSDRVGSYMGGYFPAGGATLPTGATWRHITIVGGNNTMTVYVNGQLMGSGNVQPTEDVKGIGFYQGGAQKFANALDEFRIESYSRSSNWVWACWLNMASNSTFNTCQAIRLF